MDSAHGTTNGESRRRLGVHIEVLCGDQWIAQDFFDSPTITVGQSRRNSLVLVDDQAPRSLPLFHRSDDGYALHYTDDTSGEVRRRPGGPPLSLAETHLMSSEHAGGYDLDLREGAMGRVDVGDETLVFEVVAAPERLALPRNRSYYWLILPVLAVLGFVGAKVWLPRMQARRSLVVRAVSVPAGEVSTARGQVPQPAPSAPETVSAPAPVVAPVPPVMAPRPPPLVVASAPRAAAPPVVKRHVQVSRVARTPPPPSPARRIVAQPDRSPSTEVMPPQAVARELAMVQGAVTPRYVHALRDRPDLRGDVLVRIAINGEGRVTSAMVVRDELGVPEVRNRLLEVLRGWHTPQPVAESAMYEIPFHFEPTL